MKTEIKRDWEITRGHIVLDKTSPTIFATKGFSKHGFPGEVAVVHCGYVSEISEIEACAMLNRFCISKIRGRVFEYDKICQLGKFTVRIHEVTKYPEADINPEDIIKYQIIPVKRYLTYWALVMGAKGFRREALAMISEQRWGTSI